MEFSISCPLCSQPGFSDVNSLWLTLIRVTTRQLTCPVCQEVLCGLDKLTIHLVSHSLHDHLVQACLASNLSATPAVLTKGMQIIKGSLCTESVPSQDSVSVTSAQPPESSSSSYVFVNYPSVENNSVKERDQVSAIGNVGLPAVKDNTLFAHFPLPKPEYPLVFMAKADNTASTPENISSVTPVMCQTAVPIMSDSQTLVNFNQPRGVVTMKAVPSQCKESCVTDPNHNPHHHLSVHKPSEPEVNHTTPAPNIKSPCQVPDLAVCCQVCGLTFKDDNIAMLHQQLIHHQSPLDENNFHVASKLEDRPHSSKQRSRRGNIVNQSRDGSLHRFPCHICNKVFRMRGSLMVHLRVAHSPNATVDLASKLSGVSTASNSQPDVTSKLCLQNLSIQERTQSFAGTENVSDTGSERSNVNGQPLHKSTDPIPQSLSPPLGFNQACLMSNTKGLTTESNIDDSSMTAALVSPTKSPAYGHSESVGMMFPCSLCNKTYSKEASLLQHLKTHDSKQWECDVCFKSFTTKYFLKKHKRLHTGEMPYTCGICNKSFTFQQSYHKHLLYHSDEKPHSCSECGRAFKELSTLHNHQRIHTGEKPWACESCGKCFRQRVSYLVHRRIHTGAMPYQCSVCFKSFRYKSSGDAAASSPAALLQQLLDSPSKEAEVDGGMQTATLAGNKSQQTSVKSKPPLPHPNKAHSFITKDHTDNSFILKNKDSSQLLSNSKSSNAVIQSSLLHQLPFNSHNLCNDSQSGDFSTLGSVQLPHCEVISKLVQNPIVKGDLQVDKHPPTSRVSLEDSSPLPQCTPPSSTDFNIDLLQDILSMVMSPSDNAPSPSTQMRHLSLAGSQNDEDLESGLELRQLLYGPCDSDSL